MMVRKKLLAPAKINLRLRVTGFTTEGFHTLDMLNVTTTFCDLLEITLHPDQKNQITLSKTPSFFCPLQKNLLYKAWQWFTETTGIPIHIDIVLTKRIPICAGLGGGSSDAASLLRFLYQIYTPFSFSKLVSQSFSLGADIPYFLQGGLCRVQGKGEIVHPIQIKDFSLPSFALLCYPGRGVSTKKVYQHFDAKSYPILPPFQDPSFPPTENNLTPAAIDLEPSIKILLTGLEKTNPVCYGMSGSGSACFAIYSSKKIQEEAKKIIQQKRMYAWETKLVLTLLPRL